jgi:excisionase family DNA binding protein
VLNPTMAVDDFAKVLNTGRTATFDAIKRGELDVPVIKVGRRWLIPTAAVRRLLELDPVAQEEQAPEERLRPVRRLTKSPRR